MLFIATTLFLVLLEIVHLSSSKRLVNSNEKVSSYNYSIDPKYIQAYSTKLLWSGKHRQDLLKQLSEQEEILAAKEKRSVELVTDSSIEEFKSEYHIPGRMELIKLINSQFTDSFVKSFVSKMNLKDAEYIMIQKKNWKDLNDSNCEVKNDNQREKIICQTHFTTLQSIHGISFSIKAIMTSYLHPKKSKLEIDEILEKKKVPQLVRTCNLQIKLKLNLPVDYDLEKIEQQMLARARQLLLVREIKESQKVSDRTIEILEEEEKIQWMEKNQASMLEIEKEEEEGDIISSINNDDENEENLLSHEEEDLEYFGEDELLVDEGDYFNEIKNNERDVNLLKEEEALMKYINEVENEMKMTRASYNGAVDEL